MRKRPGSFKLEAQPFDLNSFGLRKSNEPFKIRFVSCILWRNVLDDLSKKSIATPFKHVNAKYFFGPFERAQADQGTLFPVMVLPLLAGLTAVALETK